MLDCNEGLKFGPQSECGLPVEMRHLIDLYSNKIPASGSYHSHIEGADIRIDPFTNIFRQAVEWYYLPGNSNRLYRFYEVTNDNPHRIKDSLDSPPPPEFDFNYFLAALYGPKIILSSEPGLVEEFVYQWGKSNFDRYSQLKFGITPSIPYDFGYTEGEYTAWVKALINGFERLVADYPDKEITIVIETKRQHFFEDGPYLQNLQTLTSLKAALGEKCHYAVSICDAEAIRPINTSQRWPHLINYFERGIGLGAHIAVHLNEDNLDFDIATASLEPRESGYFMEAVTGYDEEVVIEKSTADDFIYRYQQDPNSTRERINQYLEENGLKGIRGYGGLYTIQEGKIRIYHEGHDGYIERITLTEGEAREFQKLGGNNLNPRLKEILNARGMFGFESFQNFEFVIKSFGDESELLLYPFSSKVSGIIAESRRLLRFFKGHKINGVTFIHLGATFGGMPYDTSMDHILMTRGFELLHEIIELDGKIVICPSSNKKLRLPILLKYPVVMELIATGQLNATIALDDEGPFDAFDISEEIDNGMREASETLAKKTFLDGTPYTKDQIIALARFSIYRRLWEKYKDGRWIPLESKEIATILKQPEESIIHSLGFDICPELSDLSKLEVRMAVLERHGITNKVHTEQKFPQYKIATRVE